MLRWESVGASAPAPVRRARRAHAGPPPSARKSIDARADVPGVAEAGELRPVHDPRLAPRDEAVFLLQTAAEVEHALMVQYLYAAFSLVERPDDTEEHSAARARWRATLITIAREEMGHLATVQNLLRMIGGPVTLDREDYPFRTDFYPFHFRLEPLSKDSLAKYVVAEMPENGTPDAEMQEILQRADAAEVGTPNRVGALYRQIIDLVATLDDDDLSPRGLDLTLDPALWTLGLLDLILRRPATVDEALDSLRDVAEQGEGPGTEANAAASDSHFQRFLRIYREFPQPEQWQPAAPLPVNPTTGEPTDADDGSSIIHTRARLWGQVGNLRYRLVLTAVAHALATPADAPLLAGWAFAEMHNISAVADVLTGLPRRADGGGGVAAPPFELPYTLELPDLAVDRWRTLRDVLAAVLALEDELAALDLPPSEESLVTGLRQRDETNLAVAGEHAQDEAQGELTELRILPPLAVARFGSSPEVMDNYDAVVADATGFRQLVPAPTLVVDPISGGVVSESTPAAVAFRDATGRVRPVAPFFEVWARFGTGDLEPLTLDRLTALGRGPSDLRWRVVAANLKAARRTGAAGDGVHADTGEFTDHTERALSGVAANFKPGKSISFGKVRYLQPTDAFPEIRFRFVPGPGRVYGPTAGDPLTVDDVYDANTGGWDNHFDGDPNAPLVTFPSQTYEGKLDAQTDRYISDGYLDDTCDGMVTLALTVNGVEHTAAARFCAGVPDWAPDSLPVRTLADDLEQALLGPTVSGPIDTAEVADSIRRALETVRLMNTMAMNADQNIGGVVTNPVNQAAHEAGEFERAFEPVFGQGNAPYPRVLGLHAALVRSWHDSGVLPIPGSLLRSYDEAGDFSDMSRHKMPALMRGSDRLELTLTRRRTELLRRAALETQGPTDPEKAMLKLVDFFRPMAPLHGGIDTGTGPLSEKFVTPNLLLDYLKTGVAKGALAGAESGKPLVVPGDPDASAFVRLLRRVDHPMHGPYSQVIPGTDKTGLTIVTEWIAAMTPVNP